MSKTTAGNLDALSRELVSPDTPETTKLAHLKALIASKRDPRVRPALRAAADAASNAGLLHVIVRSFGYLEDREALEDLTRFVQHADPAVSSNALKAAAALDVEQAARMALGAMRSALMETASAAARVMVERCRPCADAVFAEAGRSAHRGDRLAAILYARALPAPEALERLDDHLRREPDPDLKELALRARATLGEAPPAASPARSAQALVAPPSVPAPPAGHSGAMPRPQTPPPSSRSGRVTASRPIAAPAAAPRHGRREPLPPAAARALVALASLLGVAVMLVAARMDARLESSDQARSASAAVHTIGKEGQKVTARGTVVKVLSGDGAALLRTPAGTTLCVRFGDSGQLASLARHRSVAVEGVLARVADPQTVVLSGATLVSSDP